MTINLIADKYRSVNYVQVVFSYQPRGKTKVMKRKTFHIFNFFQAVVA